jgi:hypothetical protein
MRPSPRPATRTTNATQARRIARVPLVLGGTERLEECGWGMSGLHDVTRGGAPGSHPLPPGAMPDCQLQGQYRK